MSFLNAKRIFVTPGITGETISSCQHTALFGSRALRKIGTLPQCFFCEGAYLVYIIAVSNKNE